MKKSVSPQTGLSIIQLHNGMFVRKRWLYFREYLHPETDVHSNPIWYKDLFSRTWNMEELHYAVKGNKNPLTFKLK